MDTRERVVKGFDVRVSEALFRSLAGQGASSPKLEPANEREKAIIESVRREERYKPERLLHERRIAELKAAQVREEQAAKDFKNAYEKLMKEHGGNFGVFSVAGDEAK